MGKLNSTCTAPPLGLVRRWRAQLGCGIIPGADVVGRGARVLVLEALRVALHDGVPQCSGYESNLKAKA
jgi:hypothetical protein